MSQVVNLAQTTTPATCAVPGSIFYRDHRYVLPQLVRSATLCQEEIACSVSLNVRHVALPRHVTVVLSDTITVLEAATISVVMESEKIMKSVTTET